ncbi:hypothetical protein [Bacillus alkalicellulosilyticus]|uniref:hypothetical protein n=1 Tax=Alkalihalobacterium alkalicellulosilyticum TaxID=1912214 RepID=UPI001FEA2AE9|nr:hypothetical protein [Bacillus alkalicellulosilyticus]
MKTNYLIVYATILFFFLILIQSTVFANSSWHWVTGSPKEMFPIAIVSTLAFETIAILLFAKVGRGLWISIKVFVIVAVANIISFLAPYVIRAIEMKGPCGEYAWECAFDKGPYYIVLFGYLFLTLVIEVPIIYYILKKVTTNPRKLIITLFAVNVVTTLLVAVLERSLYFGQW